MIFLCRFLFYMTGLLSIGPTQLFYRHINDDDDNDDLVGIERIEHNEIFLTS